MPIKSKQPKPEEQQKVKKRFISSEQLEKMKQGRAKKKAAEDSLRKKVLTPDMLTIKL